MRAVHTSRQPPCSLQQINSELAQMCKTPFVFVFFFLFLVIVAILYYFCLLIVVRLLFICLYFDLLSAVN